MKCINTLINLNKENVENVNDDAKGKKKKSIYAAVHNMIFFKSVNSAHFNYTLIVVTGVEELTFLEIKIMVCAQSTPFKSHFILSLSVSHFSLLHLYFNCVLFSLFFLFILFYTCISKNKKKKKN